MTRYRFHWRVELHAWQVTSHWHEYGANLFHFVSTLQKLKAILKSFCSVQMSQKLLGKNEFTPDECLPNFNLKFDFLERPKN